MLLPEPVKRPQITWVDKSLKYTQYNDMNYEYKAQ